MLRHTKAGDIGGSRAGQCRLASRRTSRMAFARTHGNKLSRTYAVLLDALNRYRGKGQQKVTVEHVHVHSGGQAVVGMVEPPEGGSPPNPEEQPHAIAYAPGIEMPSPNS